MKRLFDIAVASAFLFITAIPMALIAILVKLTSPGPVLFLSDRIGTGNCVFKMAKFRTMKKGTPQLATHLMKTPGLYVTEFGAFLRKYSLDELPQLFNIIRGDMSFVGPRPALFNQDDLIGLRTKKNIHTVTPGLTGWAQVNGRDELPIPVKVEFDEFYVRHRSFLFDIRILAKTFVRVVRREGIQH